MEIMTVISQIAPPTGAGNDGAANDIVSAESGEGKFRDVLKEASSQIEKNDEQAEDKPVESADKKEYVKQEPVNKKPEAEEDSDTEKDICVDEDITPDEAAAVSAQIMNAATAENADVLTAEEDTVEESAGLLDADEDKAGSLNKTVSMEGANTESVGQSRIATEQGNQTISDQTEDVPDLDIPDSDLTDAANITDQKQIQPAEQQAQRDINAEIAEKSDIIETDTNRKTSEPNHNEILEQQTGSGNDKKDIQAIINEKAMSNEVTNASANTVETKQFKLESGQKGLSDNKSQIAADMLKSDQSVPIEDSSHIKAEGQTETITSSAKILETSSASSKIVSQISESIQNSAANGDKQIVVRLDPPELGKVTVRFQQEGDQVVGVLEVEKSQTRNDIERALPQLARNLEAAGIEVKKLEVNQTYQSQGNREQSTSGQQGDWQTQREHSERQFESGSDNTDNQKYTGRSQYQNAVDQQDLVSDKSLNILI